MLFMQNISVARLGKTIVHNIHAHIPAGQLTMVMGENGCGKSTLLAALSGELPIIQADEAAGFWLPNATGRFNLLDLPIAQQAKRRALLRQKYNLVLDFYAHEVIAMGGQNRLTHERLDALTQIVAQMTHTEHLLQRVYTSLSGGEQARVQLARVFLQLWNEQADTEPHFERALLLDEPVASLDPYHQHYVCQAIREFMSDQNVSVIMVMHDLYLAARYADYVLLMKQGQILAQGDVCEVLTAEHICNAYHIDTKVSVRGGRPVFAPESIQLRPRTAHI